MINSFFIDDMQLIANETKSPVLVIAESHVKYNPDNIDVLIEQATLLAPCIVYIEKDMTKYTALPFYDFNEFIDDSDGIFRPSCSRLMNQLSRLQESGESIIILGMAKSHDRQSVYDMCTIGFNIKYEKPSYKERAEFLNLLFATRSCKDIYIDILAKKTITFSYRDLILLVQKAQRYDVLTQTYTIENFSIDKAFTEIVCTHDIYKYVTKESFYETCVHEMGHALVAAHFDEDLLLYNATSTPQSTVDDPNDTISLGLTWHGSYCDPGSLVELNKKKIMLSLAGKIAEQIFFGLYNNQILNNKNGYTDFILFPDGATSDLKRARDLAHEIYMINQEDPTELLKELYGKTLELLLSYKSIIEKGAKILEQNEFITGSQVYNLLAV